jgi:hypothetical protein
VSTGHRSKIGSAPLSFTLKEMKNEAFSSKRPKAFVEIKNEALSSERPQAIRENKK